MSKLQKFYGAQCVNGNKDSRERPSIVPPQNPVERSPGSDSSLNEAKKHEEESLGTVLADLKVEAESHLHEICGKIQVAMTHRHKSSQEMVLLKKNIGELQRKLKLVPGEIAPEVQPLFAKIDRNLAVLSRMFSG